MRSTITGLALIATGLLAACEPVAPPEPPERPDTCGAKGYQGLIGQPSESVRGMTFPIGTRLTGPDDAVTADFRPERLNIEYGVNGRIEKVGCY